MARQIVTLGKDARGNYKRDIGRPQHRFYFGQFLPEAQRRALALERLWTCVEARWQAHRHTALPEWDRVAIAVGKALAAGDTVAVIPPPDGFSPLAATLDPVQVLRYLRQCETDYPLIAMRLPAEYADALTEARQEVQTSAEVSRRHADYHTDQADELKALALLQQPGSDIGEVLDDYAHHLRDKYSRDGQLTEYGTVELKYLRMLKTTIEGSLAQLDANRIDFWQRHFERRPVGKRGKLSADYCQTMIKKLHAFLIWLAKQARYGWRFPTDFSRRRAKLDATQEERSARLGQAVKVFSLDHLTLIYAEASPLERSLMLLALNCGFGGREAATLQLSEIHLNAAHPHYRKVVGNWVRRLRTKTDVYGEWRLWPETAAAIRYLQGRRPRTAARPELLLTKTGATYWTPTKGGNPNRRIANAWASLLKRVRRTHPEVPPLGFKYLRKTAATFMRRLAGAEVASLFLAHGRASSDDLLEVYAQRPYHKVFKALRKLRRRLKAMLLSVAEPFTERRGAKPISPAKVARIKEMRAAGFKVAKVCEEVGVGRATVIKYT